MPGVLDNIAGPLVVDGGAPGTNTHDLLYVSDSGASLGRTYTITNGTVGWGGGQFSYSRFTFLQLTGADAGGNTVNVQSVSAKTTVNVQSANNVINVGNNGSLAGITQELHINGGGAATNRLVINAANDRPAAGNQLPAVPPGRVQVGASPQIWYGGVNLQVQLPAQGNAGAPATNTFTVQTAGPPDPSDQTTIVTGNPGDTVAFDDANALGSAYWNIDDSAGPATLQFRQGAVSTSEVAFQSDTNLSVTGGSFEVGTLLMAAAANVTAGTLTVDSSAYLALTGGVALTGGKLSMAGGSLDDSGDFTQKSGNMLSLALSGMGAPIEAFGSVSLAGALKIASIAGYFTSPGTVITLIANEGPGAVKGHFAGLPEGTHIVFNHVTYAISYKGGADGQDVVLSILSGAPADATPVASYATVETGLGQTASIDLAGLGWDSDGDTLTASVVQQPANGSVTFNPATGLFDVTPAPLNFSGPLSFTYTVSDNGQESDPATAVVMVDPGTPVLTLTANGGTYNGSPFSAGATIAGIVAGVDDTPGTSLEGVLVEVTYYPGSVATGVASYDPPTQAGTYTAVASFAGSADYTAASVSTTFSIAPATLTITGVGGTDKAFDGGATDAISGTPALSGVIGSDSVTLQTDSAVDWFADSNAGAGKVVNFAGYAISGPDAGNYTVVQPTGTANITPAALTITADDIGMTYADGTTLDGVNGFTAAGLQGANAIDSVALSTNASTSGSGNWNAGSWTITPSAATGTAFDPANYSISYSAGYLTVSPAGLAVVGVGGTDKVYDGTTSDPISGTAGLSGVVSGDNVMLDASGASASFADPTAGTAKDVSFTGYTISGADAGNYALAQPADATADITQAAASVAWTSPVSPATVGDTVTLSVNVSGVTTPTGTMTFLADGVVLGTAALDTFGNATLAVATLQGGNHTLSAVYSGDDDFASASSTLSFTVNQSYAMIDSSSDGTAANAGQSFVLQASIIGLVAGIIPTGSVTFTLLDSGNNQTVLGSATLDSSGNASITTTVQTPGTYQVLISYSGDANYVAIGVLPISITIN